MPLFSAPAAHRPAATCKTGSGVTDGSAIGPFLVSHQASAAAGSGSEARADAVGSRLHALGGPVSANGNGFMTSDSCVLLRTTDTPREATWSAIRRPRSHDDGFQHV